jgi:glutamate-1-semialdehyde 2,1-aminomutase
MARFQRRPRSEREKTLLEATRRLLPAGVRNASISPDYAMVVERAHGSRIVDCSGNEYIDYLMGSGPMILGHSHPSVVAAVREALDAGSTYLMISEPAVAVAEQVVEAIPCAERVCFHSTGSESTFFAMRLARAYRKREKILKFEGGFHGMGDYALMSNQWTRKPESPPAAVPNSAGIPRFAAEQVLVAPFNDLEGTSAILDEHHDELAGVIVEPMQRTIPPLPGFLEGLREATRRYGIPLIFDEIVTGFRLAWGGAQEYYGVTPDLCTVGKCMSGGHPISVICGREEIMSFADPLRQISGDDYVAQTGTFSGNPISSVAALATLAELRREGTYQRLFAMGRRLQEGLARCLEEAGIPARVTGEPPAFEVWFTDGEIRDFRSTLRADFATHARFTQLLLDRGIVKAHEKFFVSLAHSDEDVEITLEAFASAVDELSSWRRQGGRRG